MSRHLVLFAALFISGSVVAADEDPALTRTAYAALLKADDLANLKIGVRVFADGSAILWGAARPDEAAKAEAVLKKVPGITSVLNTCDPTGAKPADAKAPTLPPVARPTTAEKRADEPAARLLDPLPAAGPVDYAAIERVRRSDLRYARLTFDLRDGRVRIVGTASDPRAAWDLAEEIAPLVGNRDVVVGRRP